MPDPSIRPIAICVIQDHDRLLVFEGRDPATGALFYRPLGGGIEFGELGAECVAREINEEIDAQIEGIVYLGLIENRFLFDNTPHHELVLVYRANLVDPDRYRSGPIQVREENGVLLGRWMSLTDFRSGAARLVPEQLVDLLE